MDDVELMRLAESKQAQIRNLLKAWRAKLAASGSAFDKLDVSIYATWGGECVLREIAAGPHGDKTVLKGGTMFRVWDGLEARPTMDLDLQSIDPKTPGTKLRDWLGEVLCSEAFTSGTGIVCRPGDLKVTTIKDGVLPEAWRLEGDVTLGPPIAESVSIHLCVEATWGAPPKAACAAIEVAALLPRDTSFKMLTAKPEWMIAEKLHSLISRGAANTRLKDFYDLSTLLLPRPGLDVALLRGCLKHVFEVEFKGRHAWPDDADGVVALTAAFASLDKEALWQTRRWRDLSGRTWDKTAPTLAQACELTAVHLERIGLLAPCRVATASATCGKLLATVAEGRWRDACSALGWLLSKPLDGARLRERLVAEDICNGTPRRDVASGLLSSLASLRGQDGFEMVEEASASLGVHIDEAVGALVSSMSPLATPQPAVAPRRIPTPVVVAPVAEDRLLAVPGKLASPLLNEWVVGVATLLEAKAAGQDVATVDVPTPPLGMDKARRAWAGVSKRQGFDSDLDAVLDGLRNHPAPGVAP